MRMNDKGVKAGNQRKNKAFTLILIIEYFNFKTHITFFVIRRGAGLPLPKYRYNSYALFVKRKTH